MLSYGCTRLEVGVQSVYEDVARDTNRHAKITKKYILVYTSTNLFEMYSSYSTVRKGSATWERGVLAPKFLGDYFVVERNQW